MSKVHKKILYRRELYAALVMALPISSMAAVLPASGANGPAVSGGDVPVVQIVTPNGAGVSHNQFGQFDVGAQGVVLNNSGSATSSQLAGQIAGNSNLANGAASVIVAEVTGKAVSQLNGALEIAGQRAAVVIANPNGISADGLSFINASRATLATGTPQFIGENSFGIPAGTLNQLSVSGGVINVTGKGIDATGVDIADLFARSITLNAELRANTLAVVTGRRNINYGMKGGSVGYSTTELAGAGEPPKLALDVSAMGGMYANAIRMVGTEKGVGVNIAGTIKGTSSVNLDSGDMANIAKGGSIQSGGLVNINAGTHVFNAGSISADGDHGNISISSGQTGYSATFDSQGGTISAPNGRVTLSNFGHKSMGVLITANGNLARDDHNNVLSANSPVSDGNGEVAQRPAVTPAVEPPVDEPKPVEQPKPPVEEPKPVEQPKPPVEEPKPVEQPKPPVEEPKPVEQPKPPVEEPKPVEQPKPPVEEPKPVEQPKPPVEEPKPVEQPKPVEDPKPVAEPEQPAKPPKPADDHVDVGQVLQSIFDQLALLQSQWSRPSYGYSPWGRPSFGYAAWNRPSYGYAPWSAPSYGYTPWMPTYFRPQPVFSPARPTAAYGFRPMRWHAY